MAIVTIRDANDPVLRGTAADVPAELFATEKLKKIITDMSDTMDAESDGVAIAAPQIGLPYRIFLVRYDRILPPPKEGEPPHPAELGVFVNPKLVRLSQKSKDMDEGCLSVRGIYGKVKRRERATVRAYDEQGHAFERGGGGVLAQAFQHEIDHLNGILFIDHATELVEVKKKPEEVHADES